MTEFPDLLEHQFCSYAAFEEILELLVKKSFFPHRAQGDTKQVVKVGKSFYPVEVTRVSLLPSAYTEEECYVKQSPYQRRIILDVTVSDIEHPGVLLGAIPALTSRGTLLFGRKPVRERVAIVQLLLLSEVQLARMMKLGSLSSKRKREIVEKHNTFHNTDWTEEKLKEADESADLKNYYARALGDLLQSGMRLALRRISTYFWNNPITSLDEVERLLLPCLPQMFTPLVERYLTHTGLVQLLDKTNPLAEIAHKRKVTFCGSGGLRSLHSKEIREREVHSSQQGRLCPIETPESVRIGLNLHLALGATMDKGRIEAKREGHLADMLGASVGLIPFVEQDDMNRAMMGAKNMKQALPLLHPEPPLVKTSLETRIGRESCLCLIAEKDGQLLTVSRTVIQVYYDGEDQPRSYPLTVMPGAYPGLGSFYRLPTHLVLLCKQQGTVTAVRRGRVTVITSLESVRWEQNYNVPDDWKVAVKEGQHVEEGEALAVRPRFQAGDVLADSAATVNGELALGVNLLVAYMSWYGYNFEDAIVVSRRLVDEGVFTSLHLEERENSSVLVPRPLMMGDKLTGRHGNKGVVSLIQNPAKMPHLADGTLIDVILNPHGVISRMNVGQLLEAHWGWVAKRRAEPVIAPLFTGAGKWKKLQQALQACGMPDGKTEVIWENDEGKACCARVVVGYQYLMKLNHRAVDKLHVRGQGKRTSVTHQPPKGKKRGGGQRVGEMEVWALQAHQAQENLRELLTVKSDLVSSTHLSTSQAQKLAELFELDLPEEAALDATMPSEAKDTGVPESSRVFILHLRALGIHARLLGHNKDGQEYALNIGDPQTVWDPSPLVRMEFTFATTSQIQRWAKGKRITEPSYAETRYHCEDCGFTAREREWEEKGGKPGPRRCPSCGSSEVEAKLAWHRDGLMGERIFGKQESKERWQGAYILLAQPIPYPLFPQSEQREIDALYVLPPALRPLLRGNE